MNFLSVFFYFYAFLTFFLSLFCLSVCLSVLFYGPRCLKLQEAQLSPRDRAMRRVN